MKISLTDASRLAPSHFFTFTPISSTIIKTLLSLAYSYNYSTTTITVCTKKKTSKESTKRLFKMRKGVGITYSAGSRLAIAYVDGRLAWCSAAHRAGRGLSN